MFLVKPILDSPGGLRVTVLGACLMVGLLRAARTYRERSDK